MNDMVGKKRRSSWLFFVLTGHLVSHLNPLRLLCLEGIFEHVDALLIRSLAHRTRIVIPSQRLHSASECVS